MSIPREAGAGSLRETVRRLESALRAARIGTWYWDVERDEVTWDDTMAMLFGLDPDGPSNDREHIRAAFHPDDLAKLREAFRETRRSGRGYETDVRVIWPDGSLHVVLCRGDADPGPDGGRRIAGVAWEVTERRTVERALRRRLEFEKLLSSLAALMSHVRDDEVAAGIHSALGMIGRFLRCDLVFVASDADLVSAQWSAEPGWPGDGPSGPKWVLPPAWKEALRRESTLRVDDVGAHGQAAPLPPALARLGSGSALMVALPSGDGALQVVGGASSQSGHRWRDDDPLFLRLAADVLMRERVRRDDGRVSAALARAGHELISVVDQESILRRTCELAAELVRADASMLLLLDARAGAYDPVAGHGFAPEQWAAIRMARFPYGLVEGSGAAPVNEDVTQLRAGVDQGPAVVMQQRVGFDAGLHARLKRGGEVIGSLAALRRGGFFSPTDARILAGLAQLASLAIATAVLVEELESANRVKSDFLATMSHELRTPLNIIIGYDDLLLEGAFGELAEGQRDVVERIARSSRGLLQMIEATLTIDRLDRGRINANLRTVAPAGLLAELEAETVEIRSKPEVNYRAVVAPDLPALRTDPAKLKMILRNLLENAMKFTASGSVVLEAAAEDGGLAITVRDSGAGIEPDAVPVIFEPFRQGLDQNEVRPGGVGLGLYIVRRLLELLGGTISVESAVGVGSAFRVWLPLDPENV